ncbi:hypothetical protein GCM10007887_43560 [Methylobacterium haplocladii]|nr:hypothetical protein GCM10007887_43560 [Methylobacterium haplocladii]
MLVFSLIFYLVLPHFSMGNNAFLAISGHHRILSTMHVFGAKWTYSGVSSPFGSNIARDHH